MSHPERPDLEELLSALTGQQVEFIVVGGVAAVVHGAPITTQDLDVVYRASPENIDRLVSFFEKVDARVRDIAGRDLRPQRSHLEARGQLNLLTVHGPFDPMGKLHDGRGYEELLPLSVVARADELEIRVLDLPTLIEVKAAAGRAKDRRVLPELLALLREREP